MIFKDSNKEAWSIVFRNNAGTTKRYKGQNKADYGYARDHIHREQQTEDSFPKFGTGASLLSRITANTDKTTQPTLTYERSSTDGSEDDVLRTIPQAELNAMAVDDSCNRGLKR